MEDKVSSLRELSFGQRTVREEELRAAALAFMECERIEQVVEMLQVVHKELQNRYEADVAERKDGLCAELGSKTVGLEAHCLATEAALDPLAQDKKRQLVDAQVRMTFFSSSFFGAKC